MSYDEVLKYAVKDEKSGGYRCRLCRRGPFGLEYLKRHFDLLGFNHTSSLDLSASKPKPAEKKAFLFYCSICGASFFTKSGLEFHLEAHKEGWF